VANPIGAIGSAALMLDHLGHAGLGDRVRAAIAATIRAGVLTPDVGGTATTREVTDAVLAALDQ
jgi:tartrate dehydrogenase/decarboxylase/D-malate dehydrogenase